MDVQPTICYHHLYEWFIVIKRHAEFMGGGGDKANLAPCSLVANSDLLVS